MRFTADWQREHPERSLLDFVAYLDLFEEAGGDLETDRARDVETDGVQLMTIYQAKGLEYEMVVVPRLVEGQFPDTRDEVRIIPIELLRQLPPKEFAIDEERRLCFVAMTRARSRLLLTSIDSPARRQVQAGSPARSPKKGASSSSGARAPSERRPTRRMRRGRQPPTSPSPRRLHSSGSCPSRRRSSAGMRCGAGRSS